MYKPVQMCFKWAATECSGILTSHCGEILPWISQGSWINILICHIERKRFLVTYTYHRFRKGTRDTWGSDVLLIKSWTFKECKQWLGVLKAYTYITFNSISMTIKVRLTIDTLEVAVAWGGYYSNRTVHVSNISQKAFVFCLNCL